MNRKRHKTPTAARLARRSLFVLTLTAAGSASFAGCASSDGLGERGGTTRTLAATTAPTTNASSPRLLTFQTFAVEAAAPAWAFKTNSINERSEHVTWVSPSGRTAYGAIFFKLPFPVGHDLAFTRGYLAETRRVEGEPEVLEKYWDDALGGLRFKVRSPKYTVEAKFFVKGLRGYSVYAGTLTGQPVDEAELAVARAARESTRFSGEVTGPQMKADGRR